MDLHQIPKSEWREVSVRNLFSFLLPLVFKPIPVQGIDNYVGRYQWGTAQLEYSYGWYEGLYNEVNKQDFTIDSVQIADKKAFIVSYSQPNYEYRYITGVYFPIVDSGEMNRLKITYRSSVVSDRDIAVQIFLSITFPTVK